jgi:hypothetical protein
MSYLKCVAIIICIDYADYLEVTLPISAQIFEKIYVVTQKSDKDTIKCVTNLLEKDSNSSKYNNIELLFTEKEKLQENGCFNKTAIVMEYQEIMHPKYHDYWICHLDADIVLPLELKTMNLNDLDKNFLYGIRRKIFLTRDDYKNNKVRHVHVGEQISGYFQLYYDKTKLYKKNKRGEYDIEFSHSFGNNKKYFSFTCDHLGSFGLNALGRRSQKW